MPQFYSPLAFLLVLVILVILVLRRFITKQSNIKYSDIHNFTGCKTGWRTRLLWLPLFLRVLCLLFLIIAIARPREGTELSNVSTEGVAMQLVVDRSSSMDEPMIYQGRQITRFQAVQMVIEDFVNGDGKDLKGRPGDMIGLITFARYPDTVCPLVHSHNILADFVEQSDTVKYKQEDGTAIGDAIALAAARLFEAEKQLSETSEKLIGEKVADSFKIKSKVIILLTDGVNNSGDTTPAEAVELAKKWGIKIYAVGIGSNVRSSSVFDMMTRANIDEALLNSIAQKTGGFYARADSPEALKEIYEKIDKLEKTEITALAYYDYAEKFEIFAVAALALLLLETILSTTLLRRTS